jgi:hypothetical protein
MKPKSIVLAKDEIPRKWYNILADIKMNPPLGPDGKPISPDMLAPVFPMNLIEQEVSSDRWIDIPEPVLDVLSIWRPAPLTRATAFEKALGTPAKIYFKNEGMSPPGSHKPNTAVPQAYYNKVFGIEKITTETGAGQWGSALSFACAQYGSDLQGIHGADQFRPETLPQGHDGNLGGQVHRLAQPMKPRPAGTRWKRIRTRREAWVLPSPKPWRLRSATPPARPDTLLAVCSTT